MSALDRDVIATPSKRAKRPLVQRVSLKDTVAAASQAATLKRGAVSIFDKRGKKRRKRTRRPAKKSRSARSRDAGISQCLNRPTIRGYDFLQRHIFEIGYFQSHTGGSDEFSSPFPCPCGEKAEIVHGGCGKVCTVCGTVIDPRVISEYSHLTGSAEGNDSSNGEEKASAIRNTSGIANHSFLRNAMTGSQVHEFIDSEGKFTVIELPEAEADKRNKTLAAKLRELVGIMKLTQRVFDSGLAIFQNLEKNGYFRQVKVPYKDEEKVLPMLIAVLYISCKVVYASRSLRELCNVSADVRPRDVNCWLKLMKQMCTIQVPVTKPAEFVGRFCQMVRVHAHEERIAREILINVAKFDVDTNGRHPREVALAAIYMATCSRDDPPAIAKVAELVGISGGVAERTYSLLRSRKEDVVPVFMKNLLDLSGGLATLPVFKQV